MGRELVWFNWKHILMFTESRGGEEDGGRITESIWKGLIVEKDHRI